MWRLLPSAPPLAEPVLLSFNEFCPLSEPISSLASTGDVTGGGGASLFVEGDDNSSEVRRWLAFVVVVVVGECKGVEIC